MREVEGRREADYARPKNHGATHGVETLSGESLEIAVLLRLDVCAVGSWFPVEYPRSSCTTKNNYH